MYVVIMIVEYVTDRDILFVVELIQKNMILVNDALRMAFIHEM